MGALDELRAQFFNCFFKGVVMSFLPASRANAFAQVRCLIEDAAQQAAGSIERSTDIANPPCLKASSVSGTAAIAVKFELKTAIGAQITIVVDKLNRTHGLFLSWVS